MTGIVVIPAVLLYLLLAIVVVYLAIRYARKSGRSAKRWGLGAVLAMYLIPFWDWLPTVATHHYYCSKDAGFWAYKTVDQWKAENPGVMETLVEDKNGSFTRIGNDKNHTDTQTLNQRFRWRTEKHRNLYLLPIYRWKRELVDIKNGEVVARHIDYSSGEGVERPKFWMRIQNCPNGIENRNAFYHLVEALVNANKEGAK